MSNTVKRLIASVSTVIVLGLGFTWLFTSLGIKISNGEIVEVKEDVQVARTEAEINEVMHARSISMTLVNEKKGDLGLLEFGIDNRLTNAVITDGDAMKAAKFRKAVDYIIIEGEKYYLSDVSNDRIGELAFNAIRRDSELTYQETNPER
ncbi:hypothetical protein [uncultured Clostridium sp.]|jgi:hypothetical protein|uniref:hypothetical protein n=1 Tax=uncultured Clostridium sp. TaxID=59620 RepID=UPI0026287AA7|nr:hypothetical protein [uncultured Clostridium sp.]